MIELSVWLTHEDALVTDDVAEWRSNVDREKQRTYIFHQEVPDFDSKTYLDIVQPNGFINNGTRCITIWNANLVNQAHLEDFLDTLDALDGVEYEIGLIANFSATDKDIANVIYDYYEPETMSYALVDEKKPIEWADNYLKQWCNAVLTDEAYDYLSLAAISDSVLIATTISHIYRDIGPADKETKERSITRSMLENSLTGLGEAHFFDMVNAINDGKVNVATSMSNHLNPNQIHGVITSITNRLLISMFKSNGMKSTQIHEAFRDNKREDDERTVLIEKALAKGKEVDEAKLDKIRYYKMSDKQVNYLFKNSPAYNFQELNTIWSMIAKTDLEAKSGSLTGSTMLEFASTIALVNKLNKQRTRNSRKNNSRR